MAQSPSRAAILLALLVTSSAHRLPAAGTGTQALPDYLPRIDTEEEFVALSVRGSSPRVDRETKYILPARNDASLLPPVFQNANLYPFHHEFLRSVFPARFPDLTLSEYLNLVERRATRDYHAGTITRYYDPARGYILGFTVYTDGSDPAELLEPAEVLPVYTRLKSLIGLQHLLEYAPLRTAEILKARGWVSPGFPVYLSAPEAPADVIGYSNLASYGTVRIMTLEQLEAAVESGSVGWQDILVLDDAPTDIEAAVGGVVTAVPQGELSHLAVRLARRGVPNGFVKGARQAFGPWASKLVRLAFEQDSYGVREASLEEAEEWWASHRPSLPPVASPDAEFASLPRVTEIDPAYPAIARFGGKAAGLARLYSFLPVEHQTEGFAIPFRYYFEFIRSNTRPSLADPSRTVTYEEFIGELLADPRFRTDGAYRRAALENFIEDAEEEGEVAPDAIQAIGDRIIEVFGDASVKVRFRSSSNAEDSPEFTGAGLYESTSVCLLDDLDGDEEGPSRCDPSKENERTVARGLKRVWMSLWGPRAFEEREYFQMDHLETAMGVLVTRAFPAEDSNGVAFTGNPSNRLDPSFVVNVQVGDTSVVSPGPGIESEKDVLVMDGAEVGRIIRARASSLVVPGQRVLSDAQLGELGRVLALVHSGFLEALHAQGESTAGVLVDVEFKFQDSRLVLKQARPFLVSDTTPPGPVFEVIVPPVMSACGLWEEFREPRDEYRLKSVLSLRSGSILLPARAGVVLAPLVQAFEFGPGPWRDLAPLDSGVARLQSIDGGGAPGRASYHWVWDQRFDLDGRVVEIRSDLYLSTTDGVPDGPFKFDQETFGQERTISGGILEPDGNYGDTLRFGSCTYETLPLWEVTADLEGGDRLFFHLRYQEPFAGSGPANVVRGEAMLGGDRFVETAYRRLVYAADHHNWNEEFLLVFDPLATIGGTPGVKAAYLREGYAEIPRGAALLGEDFEVLRDLRIVKYSQEMVTGSPPGAFRRGDADGNGSINITDPVRVLNWLFSGETPPGCFDAADADDSGTLNITDAVRVLVYLFLAPELAPAPPGPSTCGFDENPDDLAECPGGC